MRCISGDQQADARSNAIPINEPTLSSASRTGARRRRRGQLAAPYSGRGVCGRPFVTDNRALCFDAEGAGAVFLRQQRPPSPCVSCRSSQAWGPMPPWRRSIFCESFCARLYRTVPWYWPPTRPTPYRSNHPRLACSCPCRPVRQRLLRRPRPARRRFLKHR